MRVLMTKTPQGALIPANGEAADMLEKIKAGKHVWVEVKRALNPRFRAKWELLIDVGFDAWEPAEVDHPVLGRIVPEKDRASFRDSIKVACGCFHLQWSLDGTSRIVPDSVAFEKMEDDAEFERRIYSPTINVLLKMVLRDKTEAELRQWVDQVLRFA
jgi:hypothetical protein